MSEHLSLERISALLDDAATGGWAASHLDGCEECRAEYERMSRMRMALSAMTEREPPAGEWDRIRARLSGRGASDASRAASADGHGGEDPSPSRPGLLLSPAFMGWPLRAAAAVVLFAAGILAGLQLTSPLDDPRSGEPPFAVADRGPAGERADPGSGTVARPSAGSSFEESGSAYLTAMSELRQLVAPRWAGVSESVEGDVDPVAAAERIARLDALIRASTQALEESPTDPVASDLLFQLVDERNELASRFRESLRLTGLEYR